jgi:hypothetical protein
MHTNLILVSNLQTANIDPDIGIDAAKLRCKHAELPTADTIVATTDCVASDFVLTDDPHIKQVKETKALWI